MFTALGDWLVETPLHFFLSDTTKMSTWLIVPMSQTIHILAVSVLMICAGLLNLRALRIAGTRETLGKVASNVMPWTWGALAVLLATGIVQTIAEPTRELGSTTFLTKMTLVLISVAIVAVVQNTTKSDENYWERTAQRKSTVSLLAVASLTLWFGIAVAGRLVAYAT